MSAAPWVAEEQAVREKIKHYACTTLLQRNYALGAELPSLDCSGLTKVAWRYGTGGHVELFHQAARQFRDTARVFPPDGPHIGTLRTADLVFYEWSNIKKGFGHVALYLGWWHGLQWVAQATEFGVLSEVIPIDFYVPHEAFGRVKWGHYTDRHEAQAVYDGQGAIASKFTHLFKS